MPVLSAMPSCRPSRPIERGIAGPWLLARVLTSKYAEHTPLYRQSEMYGRQSGSLTARTEKVSTRRAISAGFSGVLQADAYAGFNELYHNGQITEAACWAHAAARSTMCTFAPRQR